MPFRYNGRGDIEEYDDDSQTQTASSDWTVPITTFTTTPVPGLTGSVFVANPTEASLNSIRNDLTTKGVPDVTINGWQISGLIQQAVDKAIDGLRKGTVSHIAKLERDIEKLKLQLALTTPSATDPTTGRMFREDAE